MGDQQLICGVISGILFFGIYLIVIVCVMYNTMAFRH